MSYLVLLIAAWFIDTIALFFAYCILVGVIIAFFKGRLWCNWICPRGQLADYLLIKISRRKPYPESLKNTTLQFLIMFFISSVLIYNVIINWGNWVAVSRVFLTLITFTTIIAALIGILFKPRSWCNICSIATIIKYASLKKGEKQEVIEDKEDYLEKHKDEFK